MKYNRMCDKLHIFRNKGFFKKVQESASKEVISLRWIEKWDGKLPVYQLGNGSNTLIQHPTSN